jgi:hypothetical protein
MIMALLEILLKMLVTGVLIAIVSVVGLVLVGAFVMIVLN